MGWSGGQLDDSCFVVLNRSMVTQARPSDYHYPNRSEIGTSHNTESNR